MAVNLSTNPKRFIDFGWGENSYEGRTREAKKMINSKIFENSVFLKFSSNFTANFQLNPSFLNKIVNSLFIN